MKLTNNPTLLLQFFSFRILLHNIWEQAFCLKITSNTFVCTLQEQTVYGPLFFHEIVEIWRVLPLMPHPLSSFDTHERWQPVTQSARSWRSHGKMGTVNSLLQELHMLVVINSPTNGKNLKYTLTLAVGYSWSQECLIPPPPPPLPQQLNFCLWVTRKILDYLHTTIIATLGFMGFQIFSSLKSFTMDNFVVQTVNSL